MEEEKKIKKKRENLLSFSKQKKKTFLDLNKIKMNKFFKEKQTLFSINALKGDPTNTVAPGKKISIFNNPGKAKVAHAYSKLVTAVRKNVNYRINNENDR